MDSVIEGSPTTDRRVRLAINYAIDRQAIVKNIYRGFQDIADGQVITRETFGYNPNLKPYPYDPKRARELLAEAGYPNGFQDADVRPDDGCHQPGPAAVRPGQSA
ncbi:MAG: hypothetical protein KatS3mg061_3118 [Dehalococcoidia bacterium]|nr:MAG: hypothetical protein KatS3mg061_3118 [Dehalococcoidia bacterium]